MLAMCQGSAHDWIVIERYDKKTDSDVGYIVCSQCNAQRGPVEEEE
jgi:hypothetical protein